MFLKKHKTAVWLLLVIVCAAAVFSGWGPLYLYHRAPTV